MWPLPHRNPIFSRRLYDLHIPDMRLYILEREQCEEMIVRLTAAVQHGVGELFFIKDGNIVGCKSAFESCQKLEAAAKQLLVSDES